MNSFDDRKKMAEKKFVSDADLDFKIEARRNKLLGLWIADLIGKTGDDVMAYVLEVIKSDMEEAGDDDVFRKVKADIIAAGVQMSDVEIRERMDIFLTEARKQITEAG